jgi:O-antigen/teichoic acid export membrane protein
VSTRGGVGVRPAGGPAPEGAVRDQPGRTLLASGIAYGAAMLAAGVLNLGFNVVAAQYLRPAAFGELAALIALINLLLVALGAVTRTATAVVAASDDPAVGAGLLRRGRPWLAVAGVGGALALGALARPVASALHLDRVGWIWLTAAALLPGYAGALNVGVLQGLRLFRAAGGVNLLAAASKFAALVALALAGVLGVTGGTLATLVEVTVVWVASAAVLAGILREVRPAPAFRPRGAGAGRGRAEAWRESALPSSLTVARLLFFNLDILLVRHYLSGPEAGLYAALGVTGRIIAYGTGMLPPVIYPYLVRYRGDARLAAQALAWTCGVTALVGLAAIVVFYLAPGPVVRLLFGRQFAAIAPYVAWYGAAFLFYSLSYVLLHYLLAVQTWWVWGYALGGSAVECAALMLFHADIAQVTHVVAAFFGAMFLCSAAQAGTRVARAARAGNGLRAPA